MNAQPPPEQDLGRFAAARPQPKPGILDITPYKPGKATAEGVAHPVKLSGNENILGSSPKARAAYAAAIDQLNVYPDGRGGPLRAAIAQHWRVEPERLVLGCGTDEVLHLINQVFLEPGDNIVQGQYAFGAYGIGARACQAEVKSAPEPNYRIDIEAMLALVDERTRLMFITNPANPTGTFTTKDELARLHQALPPSVVLVVDAAYAEFCTDPTFTDGLDLARAAENVIVTHTFSKIHGLAALRVGWAYAPAPIADAIDRIRPPFNVSIPAIEAAVASLTDRDFQERSLALIERWRPWLTQQLGGLGLDVVPSAANFILVGFPNTPGKTAAEAEAFLAAGGLIVRGVAGYGLPGHLRITIGLEEHNRAIVDTLAEFLGRTASAA
ncbi:MAG TPA: histidinol-phosphate transaminase [Caulobacteraceae bacterium]|jgi:histidinol-phosphate aminotransferase|nr:histidinol-phosphate transaminase [Caulobacteraceae bacterium]